MDEMRVPLYVTADEILALGEMIAAHRLSASLQRGMADAQAGRVKSRGSFEEYLDVHRLRENGGQRTLVVTNYRNGGTEWHWRSADADAIKLGSIVLDKQGERHEVYAFDTAEFTGAAQFAPAIRVVVVLCRPAYPKSPQPGDIVDVDDGRRYRVGP